MRKFVFIVLCASLLWNCSEDEPTESMGVTARLRVTMPEEKTAEGIGVEWTNRSTGVVYRAGTDQAGYSTCMVEPGIYRVTARHSVVNETENNEELFSGSLEQVTVAQIGVDTLLKLSGTRLSRLVISEIYYAGCMTDEAMAYRNDDYIALYNNSSDTLWLDGLCVGTTGPEVAAKLSEWLIADPELAYLPIARCGWQFPGNGHDHPLLPGKKTVVAINAVDHTSGIYGHSNSVDLSEASWVLHRQDFNPEFSAAAPEEKCLKLFWLNWSSFAPPSYSFGASGPGVVLYRMEGDAAQYAAANLRYTPGKPEAARNQHMVIPREWVLDYVECVRNQAVLTAKRVPAVLDKSAIYMSGGTDTGRAMLRKVDRTADGRIIYKDTNDSAEDFQEDWPSMRK